MPRPIEALIHSDALAHNVSVARRHAAGAKVFAVVKANAYGHGIERAYAGLRGADGFALLDLAEAERVRGLGWRGPVLLLEGVFAPRDLELCARLDLWHVIHREAQIDWLAAAVGVKPQRVFLKMNSGMNRLGFRPAAWRSALARLQALPQVEAVVAMTHFSDADGPRGVAHQVATFEAALQGDEGLERSVSNSAAILRHGLRNDYVRSGILSYGSAPDFPEHDIDRWNLRPTMTLKSELLAVQDLAVGDTVGYGSSFSADAPMRIGIVACGYADGYPRHCATGSPVLVAGQRTRTIGRVSMDMLAVDITALPQAAAGSEVTLWGRGPGGAVLPIDEVARAAGTIGYELMCALAQRVPVRVLDDEN
jgi:alanine racemase